MEIFLKKDRGDLHGVNGTNSAKIISFMRDFWGICLVFTLKNVPKSRITRKINDTSRYADVLPIPFHAKKRM